MNSDQEPDFINDETVLQRALSYLEPLGAMDIDQQRNYLTKIAPEIGSLGLEKGIRVIKSMRALVANIATADADLVETVLDFRNNEIVLEKYCKTARVGKALKFSESIPINFSSPVPPGNVSAFAINLAELLKTRADQSTTAPLEVFKKCIQDVPQENRNETIHSMLKYTLFAHFCLNPDITIDQIKLFDDVIQRLHPSFKIRIDAEGSVCIEGFTSQPDLIQKTDLEKANFEYSKAKRLNSNINDISALAYKDVKDYPDIYREFARANKADPALVQAALKMTLKEEFRVSPHLKLVETLSKYRSSMKNLPFTISLETLTGTVQFQTKLTDKTIKSVGTIKAKEYFSQKKLQAYKEQMADRFVEELENTDLAKIDLLVNELQDFIVDNLNAQLSRELIININNKQQAATIKVERGNLICTNKISTISARNSDSAYSTQTQFSPINYLPPELDEILSKLMRAEDLEEFDTLEKKFPLAVLLASQKPELKAWAADELNSLGINSFSFSDAESTRKIEIEVLPHGIGKRFYVNVYATDNFSRKRIFLRAIRYEDETYRRSAFAHFYCPIWMKLVGKNSYLSGKTLSLESDLGITNDDLEFDINNLQIKNKKENLNSSENILNDLLEPFYKVDSLSEVIKYKWNFKDNIIDAINSMDVRDRDAYFEGKELALESNAQLERLSEEQKNKYDFYKTVYSALMMNSASSNIRFDHKILEHEITIRSGIDSVPHQLFKLFSKEETENKFEQALSLLINMEPSDIEYSQDQKFGPPLRIHLQKVLNTFLDETQGQILLETFDTQIGLTNVSRWIIPDRVGEIRYKLKKELKILISKGAENADFIELLSSALADRYFQHYLTSNPNETQKISKLLIEGMGEKEYILFAKPLLEP